MGGVPLWVVYDGPREWPGWYVARFWEGETATSEVMVEKNLDQLRLKLQRRGLVKLDRNIGDEPHIVEVWL